MLLCGIDEAGYGPLLGPLVVGATAWQLPADAAKTFRFADPATKLPCLWKSLRRVVSRRRAKNGRRLHINDSKVVYNPGVGLAELERSVLTILRAFGSPCGDLGALLDAVAGQLTREMLDYSWYRPFDGERFPAELNDIDLGPLCNALQLEAQRAGAACVHVRASVILERRFNGMVAQMRNKAAALFSVVAGQLDGLLRLGGPRMVVVVDHQGGRQRHGHLLRMMFEGWDLTVIAETDRRSDYMLAQNGREAWLIFVEEAEQLALPVALASMLSKYLRELLMRRFNAYWAKEVPGLAPTAGYYNDGLRFLRDIAPRKKELGLCDEALIRCR